MLPFVCRSSASIVGAYSIPRPQIRRRTIEMLSVECCRQARRKGLPWRPENEPVAMESDKERVFHRSSRKPRINCPFLHRQLLADVSDVMARKNSLPLRPRNSAFFKVGRKMLAKTGPARPRTWRPLLLMEHRRAAEDASFRGPSENALRSRFDDVLVCDGALLLRRDEGNGRVLLGEVPLLS